MLLSIDSASFLPQRLVARLSDGPGAYRECRFEGAALFADISGYVQLTEQFCRQGERGLSKLSALLDHSFARYVDVVADYGGEVAYFAGDGLAAYWDAQRAGPEAGARAVACGIALRELESQQGDGQRINPDLHVGVAEGGLWGAKLRSVDERCDVLLGGVAMRDAARAEGYGARGEVVISDSLAHALGTRVSTTARADGHRLVQALTDAAEFAVSAAHRQHLDARPVLLPSLVQHMLPGPLVHGQVGSLDWSAEIREVCALFARIDGLHEAQTGALDAFQRAARVVHETMRGFAGTPGQLVIDDKGLVFHIAFGAPLNAHADDRRRAAQAAIALQARLAEIGLGTSIGLASGKAYCGVLGNDTRRDYATLGRPMNLAARLMAGATEGIRCVGFDPGLRLEGIECLPAEPLRPKGVEQSLPTYRLRPTARPHTRAKLCGRLDERQRLLTALKQLGSDTSAVITVVGEAGSGKSSLLRDLFDRARELGITTAFGEASASPSAVYSAWRGVFAALFGVGTRTSLEEGRAQVLAVLARAPELLPLGALLNVVLPFELPDTDVTRYLDGQQRADASLRLFIACFDRLVPKPLLIVLEDGHFMDSSSWGLCEQVTRHVRGVLQVVGLRPSSGSSGLDTLPPERLTTIELGALSSAETRDLMCNTLATQAVSTELAATVHRLTQGNPLFVHEYTLLLREGELIRAHASGFDFNDPQVGLGSVAAPLTVHAAITSRLDNLNSVERLALKTASVAGQSFDSVLLAEVYPIPEQRCELESALEGLCAHRLLEREAGGVGRYLFRHALIRDVAYNVMLHEHRTSLHRAVAEALLARSTSVAALDHTLLTHHFHMAGEVPRTLVHGDLAAQGALRAGAYREAVRLLDTCLELSSSENTQPLERMRRQRWLADAYAGLGDNVARDAHAKNVLMIEPRSRVDRQAAALARATTRIAVRSALNLLRAPDRIAASADRDADIELAKAYLHRSDVCYYTNDATGLAASLLSAIAHAQRSGPSADLATAYARFGGSLGIMGMHRFAERTIARAIEVADEIDEPFALAYTHMVRALYGVGMASWAPVERSVLISEQFCERLHDPVTYGNAQMVAFWASHYRGQVERSGVIARALLERAEKIGHRQHTVWGLRALSLFELARGAPIDALGYIERAVRYISKSDHENEVIAAWGVCALIRYRVGDLDGARDATERGLPEGSHTRRPTAHSRLSGWSGLAEVTLGLHAAEPGSTKWKVGSEQALEGLARHRRVFPVGEPTYLYFRGVTEAQAGRQADARKTWRLGIEAADRLGAHCDRERLTKNLAQRATPTSPRA